MAEDDKLKINNLMVMISVYVRRRSKTLYIRSSFRSLWQKPNLQGRIQNQCSNLVASRDKEVNQAAGYSDDALFCCVENMVEDHDMTLDIAGVGDIVLKTYFGTSWTLNDVMYIPSLKKRSILVRQLDEEGYHVGFGDQQWKVTKGSLVVAHGNKCGSLYMVEEHPKGIGRILMSCGRYNANLQVKCLKFNNGGEFSSQLIKFCVKNEIVMPEMVSKTPLKFGIIERLSRTFRAESTRLHVEATKMLWADSSMTCSSSLMKLIHKSQVVLVDIPENLTENDIIVVEHRLSLEITQSPCGSSYTSEGSENSGSFEGSGRSDEEYFEDRASSKEEGSKAPQKAINEEMVSLEKNQTCSLVKISAGKKALQRLWMFKVKEAHNGRKRVLIFVEDSWNEEPCRDVHQVGEEREVEVLRSFKWYLSELRVLDVRRYRKVRAVALLKKGGSKFTEIT
nr:hypothetical protein [Tanacetum cinerariifolium]